MRRMRWNKPPHPQLNWGHCGSAHTGYSLLFGLLFEWMQEAACVNTRRSRGRYNIIKACSKTSVSLILYCPPLIPTFPPPPSWKTSPKFYGSLSCSCTCLKGEKSSNFYFENKNSCRVVNCFFATVRFLTFKHHHLGICASTSSQNPISTVWDSIETQLGETTQ